MEALEQLREQAGAAFEDLFTELRTKIAEHNQSSVLDSLRGFAAAVDWREPWIIGLLIAQALIFLAVLLSRRRPRATMAIFFLAAGLVYNAERINGVLGRHWRRFAGQNYFDKHGVFFCALVSTPLLLDMFVILVQYLLQTSSLLISMKRKELRHRARQRAREEAANGKKHH